MMTRYVIELFDPFEPDEAKPLAYFRDYGVWVGRPEHAKIYSEQYKALSDHSVLANHLLNVRVAAVELRTA